MMDHLRAMHKRSNLDTVFNRIKSAQIQIPAQGWVKTIRQALGMTSKQLARRLKIDTSTLSRLESSERNKTVTIKTLQRAAESLNCELVYALVPKSTLTSSFLEQAQKALRAERLKVDLTMALESQLVKESPDDEILNDLNDAHLILQLGNKIWDED